MNSTFRFSWSHAIGSTCSRIMGYLLTFAVPERGVRAQAGS